MTPNDSDIFAYPTFYVNSMHGYIVISLPIHLTGIQMRSKINQIFLSFRLLVPHLQNTFLRSAVFEKVAQPRHMVSWSSNLMKSWANTAKPIKKHDTMCNLLGSIYSDVQKFEAVATEWSLITELLRTRLNESWQ